MLISSCEEDPTIIGKDILPSSDFVSVVSTDTFSIFSYTKYDYPIKTQGQTNPYIGSTYDPYFGTTRCEFVSQVRLESEWVKGNYDVDSVKLALRITSADGLTGNIRQLRITEIDNMLYTDTSYYSNTPVDTTDFGISVDLPPLRTDTINKIEINLPITFGEYLIRDQDKLFYSTSSEDFRNYFKGVYIRIPSANDADPLLFGIDLTAANTLMEYTDYFIVYMHSRDDQAVNYSFKFILDPTKANACFLRIEHDFTSASPDKSFEDIINKPVQDSLSYLQGLSGVYTKLEIPGLEQLKNDPSRVRSAVNKATLTVPVHYDGEYYKTTTIPGNLYLRYVNSSGVKEIVPDYYIDSYHEYFGGKLDTTFNIYKFNISNFLQEYLDDKDNVLKPELEVFQSVSEIKNVILKANNSKTPVKFGITLTNF